MARYFFQGELESALVALVQRPVTSLLVQHAAPLIAACFAGALGGAVGALLTMRVHAQKKYGFFDRKYGLRGLILPVIGAVVGMAIYALFGLIYQLSGINASTDLAAATVPALLALAFGLSQESLYGTRG